MRIIKQEKKRKVPQHETLIEMMIEAGWKFLTRLPNKEGEIFLLEKPANPAENDFKLLMETFWLVVRDGPDVGQSVFHNLWEPQYVRMGAATERAKQFIQDSKDIGRYG